MLRGAGGGGGDGVSNSSVKYGNKISVFVFVGRRERHQYSIIFFGQTPQIGER